MSCFKLSFWLLALINQGLYGSRNLDRGHEYRPNSVRSRFSHTGCLSLIIIRINKKTLIHLMQLVHTTDELNLNLLWKIACPLYFFLFLYIRFLVLPFLKENILYFVFYFAFFHRKKFNGYRWENPDRSQYRFQSIRFKNSIVPSLPETRPYNKI